eukprot:2172707-Rhodomonas_salina.1
MKSIQFSRVFGQDEEVEAVNEMEQEVLWWKMSFIYPKADRNSVAEQAKRTIGDLGGFEKAIMTNREEFDIFRSLVARHALSKKTNKALDAREALKKSSKHIAEQGFEETLENVEKSEKERREEKGTKRV